MKVPRTPRQEALRFIVALGLLSFFADMVYEGARSILGPFFVTLGARAAAIGVISGVGEFVGYAIRTRREKRSGGSSMISTRPVPFSQVNPFRGLRRNLNHQ